jgi:GxxExxY protein
MNTDIHGFPDLHGGNNSKLLFKTETEKIIGFSFEVPSEIGHGLHEKIHENALTLLFKQNSIRFEQQRRFAVFFREVEVGEFIPDLIALGSIIVDSKVFDRIADYERGKMINYLRITQLRLGLILNLKYARLAQERIVL